jgi:hypothetical protein
LAGRLGRSDVNLFRNQKGIIDINPEISNCALNLRMTQEELDGPEIACSPIDHRGFSPSQTLGTVGEGIQPDRAKPGSQQTGVLARCHAPSPINPAWKEWLALVQVLLLEPAPHSLAGLLCDLKLNVATCLPLHHSSSGAHPSIEGHIIDPERDQITGAQLAVEG